MNPAAALAAYMLGRILAAAAVPLLGYADTVFTPAATRKLHGATHHGDTADRPAEWNLIHDAELAELLWRAHFGEEPTDLMLELDVNATIATVDPGSIR